MKTKTSSLMDGEFTPPPMKPFGPSEQAKEFFKRKKQERSLKIGLMWFSGTCICLLVFIFYLLSRGNMTPESPLQKEVDSLRNELFIQETNVQRYEIAIDMIKEEDSVLYEKFQECLKNTE
jgi:hypothetical protein